MELLSAAACPRRRASCGSAAVVSAGGRAGRAAPSAPVLWARWMAMKRLPLPSPVCAHTCSHESPVPTSVPAD